MEDTMPDSANQYNAAITTGQGQSFWTDKIQLSRGGFPGEPLPTCATPLPALQHTNIAASIPTLPVQLDVNSSENKACNIDARPRSESLASVHCPKIPPGQNPSEPGRISQLDPDYRESSQRKQTHVSPAALHAEADKASKDKKRVGRPISYSGDPDSPNLTEMERRKIKRRIANRESARRVRNERRGMMESLNDKIGELRAQNADLEAGFTACKQENKELTQELHIITDKYKALLLTNDQMRSELQSLRSSMQVRLTLLDDMLEKQDAKLSQAPNEKASAFGEPSAQSFAMPGYMPQPLISLPMPTDFKGSQSFQLVLNHLASVTDQKSMDFVNVLKHDLSMLKSRAPSFLSDRQSDRAMGTVSD